MRGARRGAAATAAVLAASVLSFAGVGQVAAAGSAPVAFPTKAKGLTSASATPTVVDPASRYLPQNACQPGTPAGVAKLRALVLKTYGVGGAGNTARQCIEGVSEHADGRAWDWMVDVRDKAERAAAADFLAWLTRDDGRNAKRLGIMYVIYNQKIWAVYRSKEGWRPSSGHQDHVHVSFSWNGARGSTSFWTGKVQPVDFGTCVRFAGQTGSVTSAPRASPCPTPATLVRSSSNAVVQLGSRAASVKTAQKQLGVKQTGVFDAATRSAVLVYQRAHDLPGTGTLDKPTWAVLVPSTRTSDVAGRMTAAAATTFGVKNYASTSLRWRDTGKAVQVLQSALGLPVVDRNGHFATLTDKAVKAKQRELGRPATGVWTGADWKALAAR